MDVELGVVREIAPFVRSLMLDWLLLLLLLVALGVLLFCPRELDVESGTSSDGNSQPWHDFFEFESRWLFFGKIVIISIVLSSRAAVIMPSLSN